MLTQLCTFFVLCFHFLFQFFARSLLKKKKKKKEPQTYLRSSHFLLTVSTYRSLSVPSYHSVWCTWSRPDATLKFLCINSEHLTAYKHSGLFAEIVCACKCLIPKYTDVFTALADWASLLSHWLWGGKRQKCGKMSCKKLIARFTKRNV